VDERIRSAGRVSRLRTVNPYRVGAEAGGFGPRLKLQTVNLAVGDSGRAFSAAEVGVVGELTLEHGLVAGVRYSQEVTRPAGIALGVPYHADFGPVTPARPARAGTTLAVIVPGAGLVMGGSKGWFGGKPGKVTFETLLPGLLDLYLIQVAVPADVQTGVAVPMVVESGDLITDVADITVAR
jgi:hypothetical protein